MTRRTAAGLAILLLSAVLVGACSNEAHPPPSAEPGRAQLEPATKVLVVIEENHTIEQMRVGMPYLAGLAETYGYATDWRAITHPSEPNYLAIAAGSTFGITDDRGPEAHEKRLRGAVTVLDQALTASKTAATYAESMPDNCHVYDFPDRADGVPVYAARHNPWVYFPAGREGCLEHDVPLSRFGKDAEANALPNVGFLIPNLEHDAHDGSLAEADDWLRAQLGPVLSSTDFTSGRLVVIVTADEDDRSADNTVLTAVLTPALSHRVVSEPLTHYSLTRYLAEIAEVPPLRNGARAPDLAAAFGL